MKITTERLTIRPFVNEDKEGLITIISNPEVMRFSLNGPFTPEQARQQLHDKDISFYADKDFGMMALIRTHDNALIGMAGLLKQTIEGEPKIEISYRLHPTYWKQGYAIEAVKAIRDYAFTHLKLENLIAIIEPENQDSAKLALKLGMKPTKNTTFHERPVVIYETNP